MSSFGCIDYNNHQHLAVRKFIFIKYFTVPSDMADPEVIQKQNSFVSTKEYTGGKFQEEMKSGNDTTEKIQSDEMFYREFGLSFESNATPFGRVLIIFNL